MVMKWSCPFIICSAALSLVSARTFPPPPVDETSPASKKETAVLAGGCYWGVEEVFDHVKGVTAVVSGYSGGDKKTARPELIEAGKTRHAESVKITYEPSKITYGQILQLFFSVVHDPTEVNRQGPDTGPQYRSIIFYASDEQKNIAEAYIRQLDASGVYPQKIVTEVVPFQAFYSAGEAQQHYSARHPDQPYVIQNDVPKVQALKEQYPQFYK